jgi:type IV pilus assembly protein PilB
VRFQAQEDANNSFLDLGRLPQFHSRGNGKNKNYASPGIGGSCEAIHTRRNHTLEVARKNEKDPLKGARFRAVTGLSMNSPPSNKAANPYLPAAIYRTRAEDLEDLFASCADAEALVLNGSKVRELDSQGFEYLLDCLEQLNLDGVRTQICHPSGPLRSARAALRLEGRMQFVDDAEAHLEPELPIDLGLALIDAGLLEEADLDSAKIEAKSLGLNLRKALLQSLVLSEEDLAYVTGRQHSMPLIHPVRDRLLDVTIEHGIPVLEMRRHGVLPFLQIDDCLAIAVSDPSDVYAVDIVRQATGMRVLPCVTTSTEIEAGLDLLQRSCKNSADSNQQVFVQTGVSASERLEEIMLNALIEGASDIHIEPGENCYTLRFRVDGRLREVERLHSDQGFPLVARVKVLADCDISEKRLPQDGRIHFQSGTRDVDLRVNTLPTVYGEKAVMRILDRTEQSPKLDVFGFSPNDLTLLREAINAPHGMVLVTGPTGSGKTTTLYSVLSEIVSPEVNVSTVENPVERSLSSVNQTQVNAKAGLDFSTCLRALLRQDPDVIMIGEIRDRETAEIAVEASLTGHLVLATLHTNDAPSAATRLIQMGVEPFLVSATLRLVMAQRLVRKLCDTCKQPVDLPAQVVEKYARHGLTNRPHYAATGCASCRATGYAGRRGVFEIMDASAEIRELIATNPSSDQIRELALSGGMTSLLADGIRRVNEGLTTLEEAIHNGGTG